MTTPRRLSELIHSLYAAAEDETCWPVFLEMLAEEVGSRTTVLLAASRTGAGVSISAAARADPEALRLYDEHWGRHDVWANSGHPSVTQPGAVVFSDAIITDRDIVKTPFYNEFMRRFDMFHAVAATLLSDPSTSAGLACHYPARARPPGKQQMELLALLTPHLSQAIRFHQRWREMELAERAAAQALEHSVTGFIFLDGRGRILRTNRRADDILRAADGLTSRQGRLHARSPADDRQLQAALGRARETALENGNRPGSTLSIRREPLRLPYVLALLPVSANGTIFQQHGAAVMTMVSDPSFDPALSSLELQRTFGWTEAETAVASHILTGARIREIAERRGVSTETIRSQLKSLFRKAGVSSQAALVKVLMGGAPSLSLRAH